jgi:hypothetical protein
MSGPGDIDGEVSGDEAAWRDLIARFDVPADRSGASLPWPVSEDLPEPPASPESPAATSTEQDAAPADPTARRADPSATSTEQDAGPAEADLADRSTEQDAAPAAPRDGSDAGRQPDQLGGPADQPDQLGGPANQPASPANQPASPASLPASPVIRFASPADRTRVIRPAGDPRSYTPAEEEDEPYVPVPLPPPAKMDSVTKAALAGVIGGPGYLLIASLFLHWTISPEAAFVAIAAFVAGFVTLVVKLGDRSGRDDDDNGAVL